MAGQLPGLPAGIPRISELVKPLVTAEKGVMSQVKAMASPMIKPAYQFITGPITALGIEVPKEMLTPVEALEFTARQIEAGKLPIPTKLPGVEMLPTLPGMPKLGGPLAQGAGAGAGTTPMTSPGAVTEMERVLPEEAKPGGLVTSLTSMEERRRRMWMSL